MLSGNELRLLRFLGRHIYSGEGAIVDAGCFLGGSTLALASGVRRNLAGRQRPERPVIHSYDLFRIEDWTRGLFFPRSARAGDSTRAAFDRNVASHAPLIEVHEGDITASEWTGGPIEILFVDLAKHWSVCDWITEHLFPRLIPGRSVVVQQDYLWGTHTGWLQVTMEYYREEFEMLCDTGLNSVAFRLRKRFAPGRLRAQLVERLAMGDKAALMDRAASRFPPEQAAVLHAAKAHFLAELEGAQSAAPAPAGP